MFSPTVISAMSIERISNAVLASRPLLQHRLGDRVGVFQHVLVVLGRADGVDDAFADAGDDRFFGGPADQALDVGAHGDAGFDVKLNAVLGDAVDGWLAEVRIGHVDDLGIHAGLHGIENIAAGQVDRGGGLPGKIDVGLVGGDHRVDRRAARCRRPDSAIPSRRW